MGLFFNIRPLAFGLIIFISVFTASHVFGQTRGSIPEELIRPRRGEAPRYPVDLVIGELGRGSASVSAFTFANSLGDGLLSGLMEHPGLTTVNSDILESHLSSLAIINPLSFRIGGGKAEADGAISFLVRFIGVEQGITGELYIKYVTRQVLDSNGEMSTVGSWAFDELLLEDPRDRELEAQEAAHRNDFYPYERFF